MLCETQETQCLDLVTCQRYAPNEQNDIQVQVFVSDCQAHSIRSGKTQG